MLIFYSIFNFNNSPGRTDIWIESNGYWLLKTRKGKNLKVFWIKDATKVDDLFNTIMNLGFNKTIFANIFWRLLHAAALI